MVFSCHPALGATPSFQGVGFLPEYSRDEAWGVSADGKVVVGYGQYPSQAFRWTAPGGIQGLGDLPGGITHSAAYGASADGSVIAGFGRSASGEEATRWTLLGGMQGLGYLPGGGRLSDGYAVSGDGTVIVGRSDSTSGQQAFRWTQAGGMVGLGNLPNGGGDDGGNDVSADGSVVVGYAKSALGREAFRWTQATGMQGLGDLPGGDFYSISHAVSANGLVVVGEGKSASGKEAFRWTAVDGMQGLGHIPGDFVSQAEGVSGDGALVVGCSGDNKAFIWDAAHGMRNLQDVLVNKYGLDLTNWTLLSANQISPDGVTIVGCGYYKPSGAVEGWIATTPEPATLSLLAIGGLAILRRRGRR